MKRVKKSLLDILRNKRIVTLGILCLDVISTATALLLAFFIRFNFQVPAQEIQNFFILLVLTIPIRIVSMYYTGVYRSLPRYLSIRDLEKIFKAVVIGQFLVVVSILFVKYQNFPRLVVLIEPVIATMMIVGIRLVGRMVKEYSSVLKSNSNLPNLLIFGAGDLGETVYRNIRSSVPAEYNIVGFLDDNSMKWNKHIHGLPIFGGRKSLTNVIEKHKVDVIVIAINHARASFIKDLVDIYSHSHNKLQHKVEFKIVPTVQEFLKSSSNIKTTFRKIELSDLLPRKEARLDLNSISHLIGNKTVLVTGAGGTIGGELCRQLIRFKPKSLLMLEKSNTALFYIDRTIRPLAGEITVHSISGDVQDRNLLENVFNTHQPHIVFHAAAHKHVPLMEHNPQEAIKNNTIATLLLAETAVKYHAERFLLISTDKAVHPSSVMGASKRLAEMVLRSMVNVGKTCFMSVRFGNVLGSSGSVVEIFQHQLNAGGPLTVTHPEMTRYFMTTEEAVQLILQSCSMSKGGEIYVLNMGSPVKVVDLAKNFIILNGLEPDIDVPIRFVGIRPGEKLHEELFSPNEVRKDTGHPDIFMAMPEESNAALFKDQLAELKDLASAADPHLILKKIKEIIPSFSNTPLKISMKEERENKIGLKNS